MQESEQSKTSTVGIYFHSLAGKGGGAERQLISLSSALAERGHVVHVITWDENADKSFYPFPNAVSWHKLGSETGLIGKLKRLRRLITVLKNHQIKDLIGFIVANNKVVMLGALISGTKLIAAERNGPMLYHIKHTLISRWINFLSLLTCHRIILQFNDFKDGYPKFLHSRIDIIQNPIFPSEDRANPGLSEKKNFQILFVGRLDPVQKQPAMLINAFARVAMNHPNWNLKIVGDGEAHETLKKLIHNTGLTSRIKLVPSTLTIKTLFMESDLFVIPSLWEGSPNSLAEAMAHGLPAVGFDVDGVKQLIQHNITGWIVPTIDQVALSNTLVQAMSAPKHLAKLGNEAQKATLLQTASVTYARWHKLITSADKKNKL